MRVVIGAGAGAGTEPVPEMAVIESEVQGPLPHQVEATETERPKPWWPTTFLSLFDPLQISFI